jgi:hypothetical protein
VSSDDLQEITVRSLQELDELVAKHVIRMPGTYGYITNPGVDHVIRNREKIGMKYHSYFSDDLLWRVHLEIHGWWANKTAGFGKHSDLAIATCLAALHSVGFFITLEIVE